MPTCAVSSNGRIEQPILPEEMTLDIAKGIQKTVTFVVKVYLVLLGLCIALHILTCWVSSIHPSPGEKLKFWLMLGTASVIAYFIRTRRSPSAARNSSHGGAERTPLMPKRGGQR